LLESALEASYAIEEVVARVEALAALIPQLSVAARPTVLAGVVEAILSDRSARALIRSLPTIGPFLTPAMLANFIEKTKSIRSEWIRTQALVTLAPYLYILDIHEFPDLEQEIHVVGLMRGLAHRNAMLVLRAASAQIRLLGGSEAVSECGRAIIDIARWWP
jgi:hypothetical protein